MASSLRESLELIRDDAEADAAARVEFTPLGIGTTRGEMLAQINALAKACLALLDKFEAVEATLERAEAAAADTDLRLGALGEI